MASILAMAMGRPSVINPTPLGWVQAEPGYIKPNGWTCTNKNCACLGVGLDPRYAGARFCGEPCAARFTTREVAYDLDRLSSRVECLEDPESRTERLGTETLYETTLRRVLRAESRLSKTMARLAALEEFNEHHCVPQSLTDQSRRLDALTARVFDLEVPRAADAIKRAKVAIAAAGTPDPFTAGRCPDCRTLPAEVDWRPHDPAQANRKRYARLPGLAWHAARVATFVGLAILGAIYVHGGGDAIMALIGR